MVRNPLEMAPALHGHMVLSGDENIIDFRAAWDLQGERREGRRLPAFSGLRRRFLYGEVCALGAQLERLLADVPLDLVLVVVLDDLSNNPRREYLRVLQFLGVRDDGRIEFPVHNKARIPRWPRLSHPLNIMLHIRRKLGIEAGPKVWRYIARLNNVETPRAPLSPETTAMLRKYFSHDVELLGRLLGNDLSYWLAPK